MMLPANLPALDAAETAQASRAAVQKDRQIAPKPCLQSLRRLGEAAGLVGLPNVLVWMQGIDLPPAMVLKLCSPASS